MHLSLRVVWFTFNPDTSTLNSDDTCTLSSWSVSWYSEMLTKGDRNLAAVSATVNPWLKAVILTKATYYSDWYAVQEQWTKL